MKLFKNKKGYTVSDLMPLAVAFVAVAIALGLGLEVLAGIKEEQCNEISGFSWNATGGQCLNSTGGRVEGTQYATYQLNATGSGMEASGELSAWLPTIALIVAAAVIIGIIVVYLARRFT